MGKSLDAATLALAFIPLYLLAIAPLSSASGAPLKAEHIREAGTGFFFVDLESIRESHLGEMFGSSEEFQRDFNNLPVGQAKIHRSIRSVLVTIDDEGTIAAMITVAGSGQDWFEQVVKNVRRERADSGLVKFSDRNAFFTALLGQIGRSKKNGELFVSTNGNRVFFGGTATAITQWMDQLENGRRASWLEHVELVDAPIMCVRQSEKNQSGFRNVSIDTIGREVRVRVNYHARSDARAGLLAMLQPEVVGKMLTAMQQQSEARQAQAKKEAAEIAANGEPANPVNGQNRKSNVLNIGMGFKGADGLGECIQFLRNTFDVETEGLEITIQWQGLLDFQFDHAVAKEHVFSFQFTARVKEQLEIVARKKSARTR